jgi:hypothetical protein
MSNIGWSQKTNFAVQKENSSVGSIEPQTYISFCEITAKLDSLRITTPAITVSFTGDILMEWYNSYTETTIEIIAPNEDGKTTYVFAQTKLRVQENGDNWLKFDDINNLIQEAAKRLTKRS